ncbi:MAG: ABC transporter ATP-binding protein [Sphingobacteriales bacterium 46-32]|nr:MAG: ABC transporter ATP-binding protein [Sphingobacteriales bacterium 46-32]
MASFPIFRQKNAMDCGPTCIQMIAKYYGKSYSLEQLRRISHFNKQGVSLLGIAEAAEKIGFKTTGVLISCHQLINEAKLPAIIHWEHQHFVVVTPKTKDKGIFVADPARGFLRYTKTELSQHWAHSVDEEHTPVGIALLLEPTPAFYSEETFQEGGAEPEKGWMRLWPYLKPYRSYLLQIVLALLMASVIQLIFPFLTQNIVDTGINTKNVPFITLVLIAQLMLFISRMIIEFIRSRLLLHISTRINISILSDFWIKLMRLPISYFDTKQFGDTIQRIGDHKRIESFLTGTALSTLFSLFNLFIFSIVLVQYSITVFLIFFSGSVLYFLWIRAFLRYRRKLDYKRFSLASRENGITMQLVEGMQEIRLQGAEYLKRWEWEGVQTRLFKLSFKGLSLSQYQQAGAVFLNEGKNILITFIVAKLVIDGQLTLGAMLAIQYIIGQLNSPVDQLIGFMQSAQDAKISLDRLNEIHELKDEEPLGAEYLHQLPSAKEIKINNLTFTYAGAGNEPVLKGVSLTIPEGKTTAIVGVSGSGKTTLLKLLLGYYENYTGEISIGNHSLRGISLRFWRQQIGAVMQDSYIFNDTIVGNICVQEEYPDYSRLIEACRVANILTFIENLPLGFNTKIGAEGNGISSGQRQRIIIARTIYKNPPYFFLDEATNSLDANNEKEIHSNLRAFFHGKTVVVVAHRLSTVRDADNIIVLHQGEIVESGSHQDLAKKRGLYYELVRNQLELDA